MKTGIHPDYYQTKVKCVCGAKFEFGSTVESYEVEICAKCHPFYTGKQKLVDTAGRVDRFKSRMEASEKMKAEEVARGKGKTKKESVEDKMTRKAQEKEDAKEAEKAKKEESKKKAAKKRSEGLIVNEEVVDNQDEEVKEDEVKEDEAKEEEAPAEEVEEEVTEPSSANQSATKAMDDSATEIPEETPAEDDKSSTNSDAEEEK